MLPSLMMPGRQTIPHLRAAAARYQADLLLVGADLPSPLERHNTADQLLLWRNPGDLRGVMCAGRWLLWEDQVVGQDPEAIRERVVAAAARLWEA